MAQTLVNFRMDSELEQDMEQLCQELGINMTKAFCMFAKKATREKRIPFDGSSDPSYSESNMTTLCYIENDNKYLMLHRVKKEKDINKDKWVGVGGHFEQDESPEDCLLREVYEETGLKLKEYRLRGVITFMADNWQTEYMFLYTADAYEGEIGECDEGELEWVEKSAVYDLPIWEGDKIFFHLLEQDAPFFSLKLRYEGDELVERVLNGREIDGLGLT